MNGPITTVLNDSSRAIFQAAFEKTDQDYKPEANNDLTGSTACFVLLVNNDQTGYTDVYCANIGDSRCVLFDHGRIAPLSFDHKPYSKKEKQRIIYAGGTVEHGRVNGDLALARAFGDFHYKSNEKLPQKLQQVVCTPDMIHLSLPPTSERRFLLIACDGVFDVLSSEEAAKFVDERLTKGQQVEEICQELVIHCAKDLKCMDNISALIVLLHPTNTQ
jgi:protein phosphatase 2C family protein 2/3